MNNFTRLKIGTIVALVATILAITGFIIAGRLPWYIDLIHALDNMEVTPATKIGETITTIGYIAGCSSFVIAGVKASLKIPSTLGWLASQLVPIFPLNLVLMVTVFLTAWFTSLCLPIIPLGIRYIKAKKEEAMYSVQF